MGRSPEAPGPGRAEGWPLPTGLPGAHRQSLPSKLSRLFKWTLQESL